MQLFGLVNTLLQNDGESSRRDLQIVRYSVIPLEPNSGLIEWVPDCDTLHTLVKEYRETRKILLNIEHRLMLAMAPEFDQLPLMGKVEVFQHALANTTGQDLNKVLWLKSRNSEDWLERRTHYTRSLALMSIVGYILGLGDRHPSNLMLHRYSGKLVHVDFGDCFEVAQHRDKYPERIPFRLTRMLTSAMEVCGIEGTFRSTCERVMTVLRVNKGSVIAMLEAFVHDPLINWRLLGAAADARAPAVNNVGKQEAEGAAIAASIRDDMHMRILSEGEGSQGGRSSSGASSDDHERHDGASVDAPPPMCSSLRQRHASVRQTNVEAAPNLHVLNEKAVQVMTRVQNKLNGRDFVEDKVLLVDQQVSRLIAQATSKENLCQCYIGWCPFW